MVLKARTGPTSAPQDETPQEETAVEETPQEENLSAENLSAAIAKATAQIKKATKKVPSKTQGKTSAVKVVKATPVVKSTHAANVSKMAIAAIGKHTLTKYKQRQEPIGARRGPMDVVSSGSLALDELLGGNPCPDGSGPICAGYPRRYITEIYGAEASGKTTLALEAIVACQREGGIAMFLDFEHALHHGYAQNLGVSFDKEKLLLYTPTSMEEGLDIMKLGIRVGVDLIVVDSVAAMVPMLERDKDFSDAAQVGIRARKLADALPKLVALLAGASKLNPRGAALIFINQTRANIGGGPQASKSTTAGGFALKFFAYVRLCATRVGSEFRERVDPLTQKKVKQPYGNKTQVKVVKSKADAKQGHAAEIFIRYGQGIDDYYSIISTGVAHGVIKKGGAFYEFGTHRTQGREQFRTLLKENSKFFEAVQSAVLRAVRAQAEDAPLEESDEDKIDSILTETLGDGDDESFTTLSEDEVSLDEEEDDEDV
jgi:recombination protein RecA